MINGRPVRGAQPYLFSLRGKVVLIFARRAPSRQRVSLLTSRSGRARGGRFREGRSRYVPGLRRRVNLRVPFFIFFFSFFFFCFFVLFRSRPIPLRGPRKALFGGLKIIRQRLRRAPFAEGKMRERPTRARQQESTGCRKGFFCARFSAFRYSDGYRFALC